MPDKEKVIRAWECCNPFNRKCKECPYEKDCYHDGISRHMVADAIAMLKEQEAVQPKSKVRHGANAQIQHFCGNCNSMLHGKPKYCSECGKGVLW